MSDPKAYVFAVIDAWRAGLKRRDVFAKPGIRYGDPRQGMLEGETWQDSRMMVSRALGRSLDAGPEITNLAGRLDEAFRKVGDRSADNSDLRFETVAGKSEIVVSPLDRLDEPESLQMLRGAVHARMPKAGMPDIFLEVMARTGFAKAFTHLGEREADVQHFDVSLCAAAIKSCCCVTGWKVRRCRSVSQRDKKFIIIAGGTSALFPPRRALPAPATFAAQRLLQWRGDRRRCGRPEWIASTARSRACG